MKTLALFVGGVGVALLEGFVFLRLYEWFVQYTWHLTSISYAVALGVTLLISFLTAKYTTTDILAEQGMTSSDQSAVLFYKYLCYAITALIVLLIGYIIHLFM